MRNKRRRHAARNRADLRRIPPPNRPCDLRPAADEPGVRLRLREYSPFQRRQRAHEQTHHTSAYVPKWVHRRQMFLQQLTGIGEQEGHPQGQPYCKLADDRANLAEAASRGIHREGRRRTCNTPSEGEATGGRGAYGRESRGLRMICASSSTRSQIHKLHPEPLARPIPPSTKRRMKLNRPFSSDGRLAAPGQSPLRL